MLSADSGAKICQLNPSDGFEKFIRRIHAEIDATRRGNALRVIDATDIPDGKTIRINANNLKQEIVCYLHHE